MHVRLAQHGVAGPVGVEHDRPQIAQAVGDQAFAARDAADEAEDEHAVDRVQRVGQESQELEVIRQSSARTPPSSGRCYIDFQRHGQVRGGRPFLRRRAFRSRVAFVGREFEDQLVVNLQQQLRLQAVRWRGGGGR